MQSNEIKLMQRVADSDSEAMEELYRIYSPLLYTLIKKIVKEDKAAEEIFSDVFGIAWRKIRHFNFSTKNSYTWIVSLAKNKSVDFVIRKRNKEKNPDYTIEYENEFIIPVLSHLSEPFDYDKAISSKDRIENALNSLTDAQQYVIYLAFYEGLTQREIAEKLKIPLSTVSIKIKTALINLNERFTGKPSLYSVKNEFVDIIYPFSLGCLDNKEKQEAVGAFRLMKNFPWQLLGKFQNLTALLPVILDIENPPAKVINKLSTKLYHLRKDEGEPSSFSEIKEEKAILSSEDKRKNKQAKFERVKNLSETEQDLDEKEEAGDISIKKETGSEKSGLRTRVRKKDHKKYPVVFITVIFIFVLAAASVAAYFFYKNKTDEYESQIESLSSIIESMKQENLTRPEIPGIGELTNLKTTDLERTGRDSLSSANIILSFTDKRGYLHVKYLPPLPPNRTYQLWGNFFTGEDLERNRNGTLLSLGIFKVSSQPDYYPFRFPEVPDAVSAEFSVTEAPVYGFRAPGRLVYLTGRVE